MAGTANTGIYEIYNLLNGKRYIGSAVSFRNRWAEHRRSLLGGKHHSRALQRAWLKYGQENFAFRIIELCDHQSLIAREQRAFDTLRPEYNTCKFAGSTLGMKHSAEVKARASARQKGRPSPTKGRKYSREICERMAAPKRGKKRGPMSVETKAKLSAAKMGSRACVGRVISSSTRAKIAAANIGKRQSVETRKKRCILSDEGVRDIRAMRIAGATYRVIAKKHGIAWQLVARVCLRQRYEWIDPDQPVPTPPKRGGWKYSAGSLARRAAASRAAWSRRKSTATLESRNGQGIFNFDAEGVVRR